MYRIGEEVLQNYAEAIRLYLLAAEQGHAGALLALGRMSWEGQGGPRDLVQAHMWVNLAAFRATDDRVKQAAIELRDRIESFGLRGMNPELVNEAQRLARRVGRRAPA